MKIVDLTHTFTNDMPVYPGDPKPVLEQVSQIDKDTYNDHKITTTMHVGTHIDAPLHMIANGEALDEISIDRFIGKGALIDVRGKNKIDVTVLDDVHLEQGSILLLYTGFGSKYGTDDYFNDYPELTGEFADKIVQSKIKMIGMDSPSPDHETSWPAHKTLLENGALILENLTNLDQLLNVKKFEVIALPAKFEADAAPVRVIAKIL